MRCSSCMAILLGLACPFAPVLADVQATSGFEAGTTRPDSIAVAPAEVTLEVIRLIETEAAEVPAGFEEHLTQGVAEALRAKGYAARALTAAEVGTDAELAALLASASQRHDEMMLELCWRPDHCLESRMYPLGEAVAALADRLNVDAIAFVRLSFRMKAAGARILLVDASTQTDMSVSVVDAGTKNLEAFATLPLLARGRDYEDIEDAKLAMFEFAEDALADLPVAVAP